MSGQDALNPRQFFHGTNTPIAEGDYVLSGGKVGRTNWMESRGRDAAFGVDRSDYMFASDQEKAAWSWGAFAAGSEMEHTPENRVRVYEVELEGDVKPDHDGSATMAHRGKVKREIVAPPPVLSGPQHMQLQVFPTQSAPGRPFRMGDLRHHGMDGEPWEYGRPPPKQDSLPPPEVPGQQRLFDRGPRESPPRGR